MENIKDMTINHKCSQCGNCCGLFIPFTDKELQIIKRYVKEHNIKPTNRITDKGFEAHCCFYDNENKICKVYEVRPFVCKDFKCDHKDWLRRRDKYEKFGKYNSTKHKRILATFDDMVYGDYEPILRYLLNLSTDETGGVDHKRLIALIKSVHRLDILNQFKAYDENGKEYSGNELLDVK